MELEVGVSITRDAGDLTFASTETEAFFILAAHLPGFTKDEIELGISEREKQINIRGGGNIVCQEAVIAGRVAVTREISVESFDESFPVPDAVDWGGIDAWFDDEEKILIISIPKIPTGDHIMQVATERWDREEVNETDREDITPIGEKRPMETEVKMAAMGDDFTASEEVRAAPEEFKKPVEGTEVETPEIVEYRKTEAPKKELHPEHKIPKRTETLDITEPEIESKKEYEGIQIEEHRDIKREEPELKIDDEVLEAELIESEKLEIELPSNEKVEEKLTGGTEVETPEIVEYRRTEAPKKELHPEHKIPKRTETLDVTEPEIREPLKAKETDRKFHRQGEEDEQKQKKPQVDGPDQVRETEQLIQSKKEYEGIQIEEHRDIKREEPELKIDDEVLEAELIESENLEIELPSNEKVEEKLTGGTAYEKPIDAKWAAIRKPEKELQGTKEDEEPKLMGAGIEKRASIETKEEIQKQEQEHEKPAIVQKYEKSKDVGLPEKELKQRFHGFKEEDDRQLKGPDIEAFRARESLKKKELPLDLHKQNIEKPTLKEPKEMRAAEPTRTEKEENAEPKLQQPEEQEAQEPKKPIGLSYEKTSTKFQVPKESGQKLEQARIDAPEQMQKAAQDTQSEPDEEMKQYEHKVREHKEPIAVPTCEMANVVEFPQKEEPKPQVHELYEDEDRQWLDGDKEEVMKEKAKKPAEKTQKQLFEVAESTKSGEKEAKIEDAQPEEQEAQEYKKPIIQRTRDQVSAEEFLEWKESVQVHEKVLKEPDQILQAAQQIQSEDIKENLQHGHDAQEHIEFIGVPKYEKSEDAALIKKEEPKPALHALKEDEEKQWKIPDIREPKIRESQDLHLEQVEKKHMIEKPYVKAPRQILKAEELSQQKEEEKEAKQQLEQPGGLETSESTKSTLHPPYEKHDTTQPAEPKEADQKHKPKLKELVQMLEAAQVQSEELEEGFKQHEQEVQEHAKSILVPTCEKPHVTTPNQVLEEEEFQLELEKEFKQHEEELQKQEKPTIVPTCEKPKAAVYTRKKEPKPRISELQEDKKHQEKKGPDIEKLPTTKSLKQEEESQLFQQEQEIMKQKAEKPTKRAPERLVEAIEPTQPEEKKAENEVGQPKEQELQRDKMRRTTPEEAEIKQQLEQPGGLETSESTKSTLYPPYEKHDTTQPAEPKEADQKHKPKIKEQVQMLEAAQVQSEELEEGLKQHEQEVQEHAKSIIVPTCEKPQVTTPDQVLEEEEFQPGFEKEIQQHEVELQKQEKPTIVPTCEKPKAAVYTRKEEPKPWISELQEDKKHQEKGPDIEKLPTTKSLKLEEESQLFHQEQEIMKQKAEKPTKKASELLVEAIEPTQSEKEEAENEVGQPKEQELQRDKMRRMTPEEEEIKQHLEQPRGLETSECTKSTLHPPYEKHDTTQPAEPKEADQKHKPKLKELVQMLEAAQVQSEELEEGFKQHEQEVQEHAKSILVPTCEKPHVTTPNQVLEEEEFQLELEKEFKQHEEELQKQEKPTIVPTCEKPKAAVYTRKEEPKPRISELQEDKKHQEKKGPDIEKLPTTKSLKQEEESQLFQQEQEIMKQKAEKPTKRAPERLVEAIERTQPEEKKAENDVRQPKEQELQRDKMRRTTPEEAEIKQQLEQPGGLETSESTKSTLYPPYEKHGTTQPAEPKEADQKHKPKIKEQVQMLEAAQVQSEELEEGLKQHEQEVQEHVKSIIVPTCEKPQVTTPDQVLEEEEFQPGFEKEFQQHDVELQKQEKPTIVPTCEKPKAAVYTRKEEPKPWISELQEDKKHHEKGPDIEKLPTTKSLKLQEESQLFQQEQEIMKQKAEKPTKRPPERLVEAIEPTQPEEKKEAENEVGQPKEQELQRDKMRRMTPEEEEIKQEFQISAEGHNHDIIAESQEPKKQEEQLTESITLEKEDKPMLEQIDSKEHQKPTAEAPYQTPEMIGFKTPEELPHETARKEKILAVKTLEIKGMPESQESYKKSEEPLHVEAELQLEPPKEIEAHEEACPAVGAQLPDRTTVGPSERESQTEEVDQATESSIPRIQPPKSKQQKELKGPRHQLFIEEESKEQLEQQFIQPDVDAQKRESPPIQELARNGAIEEPPDRAAPTKTLMEEIMEQDFYRSEEGELEQDVESPKLQKSPSFPSKLEDGKAPEHNESAVEQPKPLSRIRGVMEAERSSVLIDMPKEATETTITLPRIREAIEPEGSPLLASSNEQAKEREFPALIQKELHPYCELQKPKEPKTASRQMPEFEESPAEQEGKPKERTHNGAIVEPPDRAARTKTLVETVMELELYPSEEEELEHDIESPKLQKSPSFLSKLEDRKVPEHDETIVKPPKPLPRVRDVMEAERSPLVITTPKEATEPTITPPRIREALESEGLPLLASSNEEVVEREFPAFLQKELHPYSDLQKTKEHKTAPRQMPEFEESPAEQEGKPKEPPAPHRTPEDIEKPTEEVPHKILEVPQPVKICEVELKLYTPKELEEGQEENTTSSLDHDTEAIKEISGDDAEASGAEINISTKVKKLSKRCRFDCRCPAFPIPPSTLLSGSAFVFSIMVLVFHFVKRKKAYDK